MLYKIQGNEFGLDLLVIHPSVTDSVWSNTSESLTCSRSSSRPAVTVPSPASRPESSIWRHITAVDSREETRSFSSSIPSATEIQVAPLPVAVPTTPLPTGGGRHSLFVFQSVNLTRTRPDPTACSVTCALDMSKTSGVIIRKSENSGNYKIQNEFILILWNTFTAQKSKGHDTDWAKTEIGLQCVILHNAHSLQYEVTQWCLIACCFFVRCVNLK